MVTLLPLGGLGEFGANSMLLDGGPGNRLLLDVGAAFSDDAAFGVAFEVPDFAALKERAPNAVVLSHAHDDHIKGLPWIEQVFPGIDVIGSQTTLAWRPAPLGRGLAGAGRSLDALRRATVGAWTVDALPVSHSIPGALALRVRGPAGTLVLLSDLRLAPSALGEQTDRQVLARWGDEGVDLVLLDSTNSLLEAVPPAESVVAETIEGLVRSARGAVVVVTFASHLGRFRQAAAAAAAVGRPVVPAGRGIKDALAVQARLGGLNLPMGLIRPALELSRLPHDRVVLVATGSQGERGSAFQRLANGSLPGFKLQPGDRVIHAARVIPGSEREVAVLFDHCVRQGAEVVTAAEATTHVSGHPHRAELREMLELVRPAVVLPIHGRRRNLEATAGLAMAAGSVAVVAESRQELAWEGRRLRPTGATVDIGRLVFDDVEGARLDPVTIRQRRFLAADGIVTAIVLLDVGRGCLVGAPRLLHWGLATTASLARVERDLAGEVERVLKGALTDIEDLRSTMTTWLRKQMRRAGGRHPLCDVVVVVSE